MDVCERSRSKKWPRIQTSFRLKNMETPYNDGLSKIVSQRGTNVVRLTFCTSACCRLSGWTYAAISEPSINITWPKCDMYSIISESLLTKILQQGLKSPVITTPVVHSCAVRIFITGLIFSLAFESGHTSSDSWPGLRNCPCFSSHVALIMGFCSFVQLNPLICSDSNFNAQACN